jgi:hypothetical protein
MYRSKLAGQLAALVLANLVGLPVFAQDSPKDAKAGTGQPSEKEMMAMMMEMAKTGENHKLLEGMVGSWDYKIKYWMSPDPSAPPSESAGQCMARAVFGGRYVISEISGKMQMPGPDGKMMDMDFKGMSVDGYDNAKKQFVSSWIDNMGTGIMNSEGTYNAADKTFTYRSEYEPMPGMKTKVRMEVKVADNNHHTMQFFEDRGGKEVRTMEIAYTRKS